MVRQLAPWFENLGKRQVKSPQIYIRDSGLLHAQLGISHRRDLEYHPKVGTPGKGMPSRRSSRLCNLTRC